MRKFFLLMGVIVGVCLFIWAGVNAEQLWGLLRWWVFGALFAGWLLLVWIVSKGGKLEKADGKETDEKGVSPWPFVFVVGVVFLGGWVAAEVSLSPPPPLSAEEQRIGKLSTRDIQHAVIPFLSRSAHDPSSIKIEHIGEPRVAVIESGEAWVVSIRYSGRNAFGGRVQGSGIAWFRHGQLVEWE